MSAVAVAVGATVVGIYGASKAASASKDAANAQERAAGTLAAQADAAAQLSYQLGKEQLDFAREQYAELSPIAKQVAASQIAAQEEQMRQGREYYDYMTETFRPVEQALVARAQEFDTEAYREQLARQAAAEAGRAFNATQAAQQRVMAAMGVNPASGRFAGMQNQTALGLSAQRAAAMTGARERAEQLGYARLLDVTGLGRGLPGASTAAYGSATTAGSAGLTSSATPGAMYMRGLETGAGTMLTGSKTALDAYSALYGGATRTAMGAADNYFGALGSLTGMGGTIAAAKFGAT